MPSKTVSNILSSVYKQGYKGYGFPPQTVSVSEKQKPEWGEAVMDFMAEEARAQSREKAADVKKYRMLSDEYDYKDHLWAIDPLNLGDKKDEDYGATDPIQHYPIVNSPLHTIWGERINRQVQFYVLSEAPQSQSQYLEDKTGQVFDYLLQQHTQNSVARLQQQGYEVTPEQVQQIQAQPPEAIQRYMDSNWTDVREKVYNRWLKNQWRRNNLDEEFIEGFRHGTIVGREFYSMHVVNNKLEIKNLSPFAVFCHKSPSERWVSKSQYAGYRMFLTPSSILDMYADKLTIEDINKIEEKMNPNRKGGGMNSLTGIKSISYDTSVFTSHQGETYSINTDLLDSMITEFQMTGDSGFYRSNHGLIEVVQAYWKSYRKVGFLHFYDENDEEQIVEVDEYYEADEKAGEWVKWFYLNQIYQGTRIDEDIYVGIEPYPFQNFSVEDPDEAWLPIEGTYYNDYNGKSSALMDLMMPWQELYDIVAHELKKDLKKAMGKVMYMSADNLPNIPGFDMNKWMYWCKEFGIAWVGQGKNKSQFSHYSAQDMSFAEQIQAKIVLMDRIKINCDAFAGFSQPRLGDASREETLGQSQMVARASVNQTEYYFWKHTQCIQRVLNMAINIGRKLLKNTKYLANLYDDFEQRFIDLDNEITDVRNLNCFVVHGSEELSRREMVRQMAIQVAAKGGEMTDATDMILATTQNEIRAIQKEIRRKQEVQRQQELQLQQQQLDQQAQIAQDNREWEKEKHYSELQSQERQAFIRTFAFQDDNAKDTNGDMIPDALQYEELFEQKQENMRKHMRETNRDNQTFTLKRKELEIKKEDQQIARENMDNDLQIAKENRKGRAKSATKK